MRKTGKSQKGRKNKIRSRNVSMEKEKEIQKASCSKIKIPIFDDSKSKKIETIEDFINQNKKDLLAKKIKLEEYIAKNDVDNEQIYIFLNDILKSDAEKFLKIYEDEFFKLTLEQRAQLRTKLQEIKDVTLPEYIKRNTLKETSIEKTFINILEGLDNISLKDVTIEKIEKVFLENNVYFNKEIDIKIPCKYGTKELQFYCLLNDLFFYFQSENIEKKKLFNIFLYLSRFIKKINENDENLIAKSNYLINILYMYLENRDIDQEYFVKIVETCIPFDKTTARKTLEALKNDKGQVQFLIDNIPINDYTGEITGNEIIDLEFENLKIKELSKNINWNIGDKFYASFTSENFMLCINYPENCKYNYFSMGEIGTSVNEFFDLMIKSPPMKQAMIIDTEASKYKYLFNDKNILEEFNKNSHLVPLPFQNYFGFTDKKSFDLYINVSYRTNNDFIRVLKKYNIFFISKSHEFKHASRIYLRLYDDKIKIKTPIKDIKKSGRSRKYLGQIFDNTQKNLNTLSSINNPKENKKSKSKVGEYGDLLELSLFGYKYDELFFKSVIFCLSESSWNLSPEDFYHNFSLKIMDNEAVKLDDLCKEKFLKNLLSFYDSTKKEKKYGNLMISKDSDFISKNMLNSTVIERKSHLGIREINRGKTREQLITTEALQEKIKKENEEDEEDVDSEDKSEDLKDE